MLRATTARTFSQLDISASKSGPNMVSFGHFDFEICFAPQRRALFRNSTLKLPKVVREWCVLYIFTWKLVKLISVYFFDMFTSKKAQNPQFFTLLTSKCASRHNGVHFFDTFSTSEPPKVVRDRQFLTLLTSKCAWRHNGVHFFNIATSKSGPNVVCFVHLASRHNGVHFFDIATSKSSPNVVCFVHFDLEICFAPQRRALFRHRNFQKWSGPEVFCTF